MSFLRNGGMFEHFYLFPYPSTKVIFRVAQKSGFVPFYSMARLPGVFCHRWFLILTFNATRVMFFFACRNESSAKLNNKCDVTANSFVKLKNLSSCQALNFLLKSLCSKCRNSLQLVMAVTNLGTFYLI